MKIVKFLSGFVLIFIITPFLIITLGIGISGSISNPVSMLVFIFPLGSLLWGEYQILSSFTVEKKIRDGIIWGTCAVYILWLLLQYLWL